MSLANDLTVCQRQLHEAGLKVSEIVRGLKGEIPPEVYGQLQAELCKVTAETNSLKISLGSLRMIGELEQAPPVVTTESLELAAFVRPGAPCVPPFPRHEVTPPGQAFREALQRVADDTLVESGVES